MAEHGAKVGDAEKSAIDAAVSDLRAALSGEDAEEIRAKSQALVQASMKLGEAMYRAAQEGAGSDGSGTGGGATGGGAANEDVVDADFEEIPDEERKRSA